MASVIAVVRLAPGRVGYFDDLTRIHLTIATPEKPVIEGMDTSNLKRAVRGGSIRVVTGSLEPVAVPVSPIIQEPVVPVLTENKSAEVITAQINRVAEVPVASEPEKVEEPIQEVQPVEEPVKVEESAVVEQPVEEAEVKAEESIEAPIAEVQEVVADEAAPVEPTEAVEEVTEPVTEDVVAEAKPKSNRKKK